MQPGGGGAMPGSFPSGPSPVGPTNVIVVNQYGQVIGGGTAPTGAAGSGAEDEKKKKRDKVVKGHRLRCTAAVRPPFAHTH